MRKLSFSSYFNVDADLLKEEGYVDISLLCDLPLFVDPFLIFGSNKKEYKDLQQKINNYLEYLNEVSKEYDFNDGVFHSLFRFSEVPYNWFGYCEFGNKGKGLGKDFGKSLYNNLNSILTVESESSIQKIGLIDRNIGADNISDFLVNIIKEYFFQITEDFAKKHINHTLCKKVQIKRVYFDYLLKKWMPKEFILPIYNNEPVILTPVDILTKDSAWIESQDLLAILPNVLERIPNAQLKFEIKNYIDDLLKKSVGKNKVTQKVRDEVYFDATRQYPLLLDEYIAIKETQRSRAEEVSINKVYDLEQLIEISDKLLEYLKRDDKKFNDISSLKEAKERVLYLKNCIENRDVYKLFYKKNKDGYVVVHKESDLQLLFRLVCYDTISDVNAEVNNGGGAVDYKFSKANIDKSLIEFKLASNAKLKNNLAKQLEVYENANDTKKSITVIIYFSKKEKERVRRIMEELSIKEGDTHILIDARNDNKESASNLKI